MDWRRLYAVQTHHPARSVSHAINAANSDACIAENGAHTLAAAIPGCAVQIEAGAHGTPFEVVHPVTLLARAYRAEKDRA
jgi:Fe-S oxidoreductase